MFFANEKELENYLEVWFKKKGSVAGLFSANLLLRQVNIPRYGVVDFISVFKDWGKIPGTIYIEITLIELKLNCIQLKDIEQISRYYIGLIEYIKKFIGITDKEINSGSLIKEKFSLYIGGLLLGKTTEKSSDKIKYLSLSIPWLDIACYEQTPEGVDFGYIDNCDTPSIKNNYIPKCMPEINLFVSKSISDAIIYKKACGKKNG